jgi:hypothetical protein
MNAAVKRLRVFRGWLGATTALLACTVVAAQQTVTGQKMIKDPAEYKAYMTALNTQDATGRAEGLAAFVQDYPHSVVLTDALEQEMAAWQAAGDSVQVKRVAKSLLATDGGNVRALGIVVALDRVSAEKGDQAALNEMCLDASGGMLAVPMWKKPAEMTEENFVALSKLMNGIFVGAEGYCAVTQKNYAQAKEWLGRALQYDPANVENTYQLAVADLEGTPQNVEGLWYCARAIHLAQSAEIPQDVSGMTTYCKGKYAKYHGGEDGWDALAEAATKQDAPPKDFAKQVKAAQK